MGNPRRLTDNTAYTPLGAYRDQITLLKPAADNLPDGSPDTPVVFATGVWAYIRTLRQQEVNLPELEQSEVYYDVRIPYMSGVNSQMTVISPSGETWYIVNVADRDHRNRELMLLCRSINDGGAVVTKITEIVEGGTF